MKFIHISAQSAGRRAVDVPRYDYRCFLRRQTTFVRSENRSFSLEK